MRKKILLSWSSGKDSAWALHVLRQQPELEVVGLFSTMNEAFDRVAMHGIRIDLVRRQADSAGLPIELISIPYPCDNQQYEYIMGQFVAKAVEEGVDCFAFGDLFLEDIRQYREEKLANSGIAPIFPLWGIPTNELARDMIASGLRARISCVDPTQLAANFSGRDYDTSFIASLPDGVDPCGEYGEFHSFAYDGPMFDNAIDIDIGETVTRDGFVFTDLILV